MIFRFLLFPSIKFFLSQKALRRLLNLYDLDLFFFIYIRTYTGNAIFRKQDSNYLLTFPHCATNIQSTPIEL